MTEVLVKARPSQSNVGWNLDAPHVLLVHLGISQADFGYSLRKAARDVLGCGVRLEPMSDDKKMVSLKSWTLNLGTDYTVN